MASVASAGSSTAAGINASSTTLTTSRCRLTEPDVSEPEEDVRDEVERDAAAERDRRDRLERVADVRHRLLDADREEDDAGDHRQVEVAVRVAGHPELCAARRLAEPPLRNQRDHVEVRPPERGGDGEAKQGSGDDAGIERGCTDPDRHDRLAERDDHDQAVPLGEVAGREPPALAAAHVRAEQVDRERKRPHRDLRPAVEAGRDEEQRDADRRADRQPGDRDEKLPVAPGNQRVQNEVGDADEGIGAREQERVVAEGVGDGARRNQRRAHRREHDQADGALVGVDRVRQPRVRGPGPPEHPEQEQPLDEPRPRRVVGDEAGHLGEREDEDQVEEELERGDALLAGLPSARLDSHATRLEAMLGAMSPSRPLRAGLVAAVLSGAPSTVHALATGRDPLEAALAAGSILLPQERRRGALLAAAVPVHLCLSLGWAVVLDRAGVRGARRGALAGLAIAGCSGAPSRVSERCRSRHKWQITQPMGRSWGALISRRGSG